MSEIQGRIPESFIKALLTRVDIIEVVGAHVQLRKAGANYVACCPFHSEKTPSFSVNAQKQFYHCFGCGVSGDVIQFLIEHLGISFVEAVEMLAARVGVEIPVERAASTERFDLIYNILNEAANFFEKQLRQHKEGASAVEYLKGRGLTGVVAKKFRLGFAPSGWDNFLRSIGKQSSAVENAVKAGLLVRRDDGGHYDRFRSRIMFPIRDRRGRVIGFGGRIITDSVNEPKYLNSPETVLFNKSQELYGSFEARQAIARTNKVIVVEGYMDVVSLVQAGVENVVATLGTACTNRHIEQLFKVAPEVIFCFDGDNAGKKAAWKALETCLPLLDDAHRVKFLLLDVKEDPDSFIRKNGLNAFEDELKRALPLPDYLFSTLVKQVDLKQLDGKVKLANDLKQYLQKLPDGLLKTILFERLGHLIEVDTAVLINKIDKLPHRWGDFTTTIVTGKQGKRDSAASIISPAIKALSLLLVNRELLELVNDLEDLEQVDIVGTALLCMVLKLLRQDINLEMGQIKHKLPDELAVMFDIEYLGDIARIVPVYGIREEFIGAIECLRSRLRELSLERLLLKAKEGAISEVEKVELQQMLRDRS